MIRLNFALIRVWGKDSERYLNFRLTGVINSSDSLMPNFSLDPTGRIEGFYRVVKEDDSFLISLETDETFDEQISSLLRYKVLENVRYENLDLVIVHSRTKLDRCYISKRTVFSAWDNLVSRQEAQELRFNTEFEQEFTKNRILGTQPLFFSEVKKGERLFCIKSPDFAPKQGICYVGHEAVERALTHGKPPYLISSFLVDQGHSIIKNQDIYDLNSGIVIGQILAFYPKVGGFCKIKNSVSQVGVKIDGKMIPLKVVSYKKNYEPNRAPANE